MRILVTGATGFLGLRLVKTLVRAGARVIVFVRKPERCGEMFGTGVEIRAGRLENREECKAAVRGADAVAHLGAVTPGRGHRWKDFYRSNVCGTRNLLEACDGGRLRRFVYMSTANVIGPLGKHPVDESCPCTPQGDYERTKYEGERIVLGLASSGCPAVVVRSSWVYGPGDLKGAALFRRVQSRRFVEIGRGMNLHQPAYVDDITTGLYRCLVQDVGSGEVFLLSGPEAVTTRELLGRIAAAVGVRWRRVRIPFPVARLLANTVAPLFALGGVSFPITHERLEFFSLNRAYDTSKARRLLGYQPSTYLEQGLKRTVEWYRSNGHL